MTLHNKSSLHMIGNAHLDPVWLWQWQEGFAEIKATFRSALDRLKEFPDFIFTCAGAAYYKWVEENAPEMFEEIRARVREGRWVIVGGWWIQPDCNLPSGESFVRHALYSQRYYMDKFGLTAKVGYNVDSFGHHGMLPQILKKSGMDAYVFMRPDQREKQMERNLFWWESIDGSRVMAFRIPFSYANWSTSPLKQDDPVRAKVLDVLPMMEEHGHSLMNFYGVGNHGGGPTIANLQSVEKLQQEFGKDTIKLSSPNAYFDEMTGNAADIPVHRDDLQHHASGCYSAHSETKALNRRAEHRLLTAEKFSAMAHHLLGLPYPEAELRKGWENVMFNQFHDIMGGCSIKEAYEDSRESYGEALNLAAVALNNALQKLSWSIDTMKDEIQSLSKEMDWLTWEQKDAGIPVVVFNPLSWPVTAPVQINKSIKSVKDDIGRPIEYQTVRGSRTSGPDDKFDNVFMASIPAMGYRVYWIYKEKDARPAAVARKLTAEPHALENDWYRLEFELHTGHIKRLFDKKEEVEVFRDAAAVPVVIDEYHMDTWAHGVFEFRSEIARFGDAKITLIERGPVRAKLRVVNHYNRSTLRQDFVLYRDKPGIEVHAKLDWREEHKLLKLSFPVAVSDPKATYEIPYGHIERPVNGEEEPGQQWLDVSGRPLSGADEYGLTLLNDSKYSFDVKDSDMRMTVVRGAIFADHYGERDELCEFMDQGIQEFRYSLIPHSGDWRHADTCKKAMELNVPPMHIIETYHKGSLPQQAEGVRVAAPNVMVTVFKKAEDGDGYILGCYETSGIACQTEIDIPMLNRSWVSHMEPYEIKTLRIPSEPTSEVKELDLVEVPIER